MKIEIGSLVKLNCENFALDEWVTRDYGKLVGIVTDVWEADGECKIFWQGRGKFFDGACAQQSWEYSDNLELVQ